MILETERLYLREMTLHDLSALSLVPCDPINMTYYPHAFSKEEVKAWILRNMERYKIFGFGLWAVCLKETGEMIGDCRLTMQMIGDLIRPEIGYQIRRDMQRKGYASEAAKAVRDYAFFNLPFGELYSYMENSNEGSVRTALSYGCHEADGFVNDKGRNCRVFVICRKEWEALYVS